MSFTLLPDLTVLLVVLAVAAGVALVLLAVTATTFFAENRAVRVARHEGFFSYYGHLATGH